MPLISPLYNNVGSIVQSTAMPGFHIQSSSIGLLSPCDQSVRSPARPQVSGNESFLSASISSPSPCLISHSFALSTSCSPLPDPNSRRSGWQQIVYARHHIIRPLSSLLVFFLQFNFIVLYNQCQHHLCHIHGEKSSWACVPPVPKGEALQRGGDELPSWVKRDSGGADIIIDVSGSAVEAEIITPKGIKGCWSGKLRGSMEMGRWRR